MLVDNALHLVPRYIKDQILTNEYRDGFNSVNGTAAKFADLFKRITDYGDQINHFEVRNKRMSSIQVSRELRSMGFAPEKNYYNKETKETYTCVKGSYEEIYKVFKHNNWLFEVDELKSPEEKRKILHEKENSDV